VVQSYEVGEENGAYFIAMEYLDGQPLDRLLQELRARGERVEPGIAARIVSDACSGLAHAHELRDYDGAPLRIIHRDVSPQNVFLTYDGQVKLVDFGIAKAAVSRARTDTGVLKGKVAYMAPEQANSESIDARADLFAMGVILWELLAGRQLFEGDNAPQILKRLFTEPIPRPSSAARGKGDDIDPTLEAIAMRALEKERDDRFASAREMRNALDAWLDDTRRVVRREDVGALVTSLFAESRARVNAEIQRHMAALASPGEGFDGLSFSSIDRLDPIGTSARHRLLDLAPEATGEASGLARKGEEPAAVPPVAIAAPPPRRRLYFLLPIALVALLGGGTFLLRHGTPQPTGQAPRVTFPERTIEPREEKAEAPVLPQPAATDSPQPPLPPATLASAASAEHPTPSTVSSPPRRAATHDAKPSPGPSAKVAEEVVAQGFLTLDTYPWTNVSENGRVLGTTPLVHVALTPGTHLLTLDNPGLGIHQTYEATIASGATVTRSLGLR
jgi:hypothetical protein